MGRLGIDRQGLDLFLDRVNRVFLLERALLFGSRARGDELEDSDYDLLLVSWEFRALSFSDRTVRVSEYWPLPETLEILCYTPQELEEKKTQISIVAEAEREGIVLKVRL